MHINYSSDPKSLNLCRFSGESDSPARRGLAQHYQWIGCLQVIRSYHLAIIGIINFAIIIVNLFVMTVMMIQVPWTQLEPPSTGLQGRTLQLQRDWRSGQCCRWIRRGLPAKGAVIAANRPGSAIEEETFSFLH